jgi:hypothetical protein
LKNPPVSPFPERGRFQAFLLEFVLSPGHCRFATVHQREILKED